MRTGPKRLFLVRCKERGYALADVMGCVVKRDGETWTVDTEHPAYPHPKPPSLPKRLSSWAKAILAWERAGKPVRSDEQVAAILEVCKGCKHFTGSKCKVCGCRLNVGQHAIINKARMATERCPRRKW